MKWERLSETAGIAIRRISELFRNKPAPDFLPVGHAESSQTTPIVAKTEISDGTQIHATVDDGQLHDLMLSVVDIFDEIELMKTRLDATFASHLTYLQSRLRDKIEMLDGQLIIGNTWDPAIQRPVRAEPSLPGQTEIRFVCSRSTGLKHNGKIIRKQEVVVSKP